MAKAKTKKTRSALTYETLPALFTGICDAIRTKTGGTDPINHQDIPESIANLPSGDGDKVLESYSGALTLPSAGNMRSYTMPAAGTFSFIALFSSVGSGVTLRKNGNQIATAATSGGFSVSINVINTSVAAGDVITLYKSSDTNGSGQLVATFKEV